LQRFGAAPEEWGEGEAPPCGQTGCARPLEFKKILGLKSLRAPGTQRVVHAIAGTTLFYVIRKFDGFKILENKNLKKN